MIPFWILGIFVAVAGAAVMTIGDVFSIFFGILIVAGGVVMVILYMILAPKYPVKAMIFVKRRGNMRIIMDRAQRIETEHGSGTYKYRFKAVKGETKAALYENLYPSGKGEIAVFFSPAPGEFLQAFINEEKTKITYTDADGKKKTMDAAGIQPVPDNLLEWMILKQARMKQRYDKKSMWEQFYPLFVIMILAVSMVVIIHSVFQGLEPVVDGFRETSNRLAAASETLAEVSAQLALERDGETTVRPSIPPPPDAG